jgi:hypothetical protein
VLATNSPEIGRAELSVHTVEVPELSRAVSAHTIAKGVLTGIRFPEIKIFQSKRYRITNPRYELKGGKQQ